MKVIEFAAKSCGLFGNRLFRTRQRTGDEAQQRVDEISHPKDFAGCICEREIKPHR